MGSEWILVLLTALTVIVGIPTFVREIRAMISASPASGTQSSARSQSRRVIITMIILVVLSCGTVMVGFLRKPEPIFADTVVNEWKYQGGVFEVDVRGEPLIQFKNDYNLVLYAKPPVPGSDRMTDPHGIKSKAYTIYPGIIYLTVSINKEFCSFYNGLFGGVELIIVLLPKKFSPEQITSLLSIDTMGGKIVANPGWPTNYPPECKTLK